MKNPIILIPSAIGLFITTITLWFTAGFENPFIWISPWISFAERNGGSVSEVTKWLSLLTTAGILNLAMGYICDICVTWLNLSSQNDRFYDFTLLVAAFGIIDKTDLPTREQRNRKIKELLKQEGIGESEEETGSIKNSKNGIKALENQLLAEFQTRLFSNAPEGIINYFSHRHTLRCTARNSMLAAWGGFGLALILMHINLIKKNCYSLPPTFSIYDPIVGLLCLFVIVIFLSFALNYQAKTWSREFWEVGWKWVTGDLKTNPAPRDWWRNDIHIKH
jgi:hypothetical protein